MAVLTQTVWQAHPGRAAEVLQRMSEAKKIHEGAGASVGVVQSVLAGPTSLRLNYLMWFESMSAYGTFTERLAADADWAAFAQNVLNAPNPAAAALSNSLSIDFPGFEGPVPTMPPPGAALLTEAWRVEPGRSTELALHLAAWRTIAESHGLQTRFLTAWAAGPDAGTVVTGAWAPKMSTLMAAMETILADPAFQSFYGVAIESAGAPARMVAQSIGTFLPV